MDALGDEMFMEDDAAYLDEASSAPAVPGSLPGEKDTGGDQRMKVSDILVTHHNQSSWFLLILILHKDITIRAIKR